MPLLLQAQAFTSASGAKDQVNIEQKIDSLISHKNYVAALQHAEQYLNNIQVTNGPAQTFRAESIMSACHLHLKDTASAINLAKDAFRTALKTDNDTLVGEAFGQLGVILSLNKNTLELGYHHLKKSWLIKKNTQAKDLEGLLITLITSAESLHRYSEMKAYLEQLTIYKAVNDSKIVHSQQAQVDMLWGNYYESIENEALALRSYNKAYRTVEAHHLDTLKSQFYKRYARVLRKSGKDEMALTVTEKFYEQELAKQQADYDEALASSEAFINAELHKNALIGEQMKETLAKEKQARKTLKEYGFCLLMLVFALFILALFRHIRSRQKLIKSLEKNNVVLRNTKQQLQKSLSARNVFFATLSHELRTPLYGVTGIVNLLEKDPAFANHREDLHSLKFSAEHLLHVINDLLEMSRVESSRFELKERPFDLRLLSREILTSFKHYNNDNKNKLHLEVSEDLPAYLIGDSGRIAQVLINIIGNSIKFTNRGNIYLRIKAGTKSPDNVLIHFEVADDGVGIPYDKQDKVFDEFEHYHLEGISAHPGTGLGLSIVKKILLAMNTTVELQSAPQKGTKISFAIPLKELTLEELMSHSQNNLETDLTFYYKSLEGAKVLVVDDNKISRVITTKILQERKINVASADCGDTAILMAQKSAFDLILMDINMPGIDGFETAEAIHQIRPGTPIVALTASDADFIKIKLRESCMKGAITKPYEISDFLNKILFYISSAKTQRCA